MNAEPEPDVFMGVAQSLLYLFDLAGQIKPDSMIAWRRHVERAMAARGIAAGSHEFVRLIVTDYVPAMKRSMRGCTGLDALSHFFDSYATSVSKSEAPERLQASEGGDPNPSPNNQETNATRR